MRGDENRIYIFLFCLDFLSSMTHTTHEIHTQRENYTNRKKNNHLKINIFRIKIKNEKTWPKMNKSSDKSFHANSATRMFSGSIALLVLITPIHFHSFLISLSFCTTKIWFYKINLDSIHLVWDTIVFETHIHILKINAMFYIFYSLLLSYILTFIVNCKHFYNFGISLSAKLLRCCIFPFLSFIVRCFIESHHILPISSSWLMYGFILNNEMCSQTTATNKKIVFFCFVYLFTENSNKMKFAGGNKV